MPPRLKPRLLLAAIVIGAVAIAWLLRWGCDDAYITFNYSRSLVRGDGLTWFGHHVEGYTNFGWVLWIAGGIAAGVDPLVWAWIGSLVSLAVVLVLTYRMMQAMQAMQATTSAALCAVAILATNFTFVAFGTSGLETMLQCALVTSVMLHAERARRGNLASVARCAALSFGAGLALWTRLDSAVALLPSGIVLALACVRGRRWRELAALAAPASILVGGWLIWKLVYYGELLPNTFHAKVAVSGATIAAASRFTFAFLHSYLLWPFLLVAAGVAVVRRRFPVLPVSTLLIWYAYVIAVGGDFMEFRFFVPTLPALAIIIADAAATNALRAGATVAVLASMSLRHAATFEGASDHYDDSVQQLATYYGLVHGNDWSSLGRPLHDTLAGSGATLACGGAGAIPYFVDRPTIDQLGLNDAWVARHGARPARSFLRPGHQRFATYEYLAAQGVTFVIGAPTFLSRDEFLNAEVSNVFRGWVQTLLGTTLPPVDHLRVVGAPITGGGVMLLWYLTPTPEMSRRIEAAGWSVRELSQRDWLPQRAR